VHGVCSPGGLSGRGKRVPDGKQGLVTPKVRAALKAALRAQGLMPTSGGSLQDMFPARIVVDSDNSEAYGQVKYDHPEVRRAVCCRDLLACVVGSRLCVQSCAVCCRQPGSCS
jgi:hypothetical protein